MAFSIDSPVLVVAINRRGRVIEVRGDVYRVLVGGLTMTCRAGELRAVETTSSDQKRRPPRGSEPATAEPGSRSPPLVRSIDLHGMTVEQARTAVADFLSRAVMDGADTLEIVHGIGTGRVRNAIRRELTAIGAVRRVHLHPTNPGVTIVHL